MSSSNGGNQALSIRIRGRHRENQENIRNAWKWFVEWAKKIEFGHAFDGCYKSKELKDVSVFNREESSSRPCG